MTQNLVKASPTPEMAGDGAPENERLTEKMLQAGVLVLAHHRQDLADGDVTLREITREVYLAVRRASVDVSNPILETGYRQLFPSSAYQETFLKPPRSDPL